MSQNQPEMKINTKKFMQTESILVDFIFEARSSEKDCGFNKVASLNSHKQNRSIKNFESSSVPENQPEMKIKPDC